MIERPIEHVAQCIHYTSWVWQSSFLCLCLAGHSRKLSVLQTLNLMLPEESLKMHLFSDYIMRTSWSDRESCRFRVKVPLLPLNCGCWVPYRIPKKLTKSFRIPRPYPEVHQVRMPGWGIYSSHQLCSPLPCRLLTQKHWIRGSLVSVETQDLTAVSHPLKSVHFLIPISWSIFLTSLHLLFLACGFI